MRFDHIGMVTRVLSTGFAIKSTGKPAVTSTGPGIPKWVNLNGTYSRFGLHVINATTVATSAYSIKLMGSASTWNPAGLGSSKFQTLLTATSASLGGIKMSTGLVPANYVFLRSTAFTTAANRKVRIELIAVP